MTDTIREQAVVGLQNALQSMDKTMPLADPYGYQFNDQSVFREPPGGAAAGRRAFGVITEHAEVKSEKNAGVVDCHLTVYIEAHVMKQAKENMSAVLNGFLGAIERLIRSNRQFGVPNVIDTMVLGNETTLEGGPYANYGSCVTKIVIMYRHSTDDPRF